MMKGLAADVRSNKRNVLKEMGSLARDMSLLSESAVASFGTVANVAGSTSTTYNINQSNSFTNSYSGEPSQAARNISDTMRQSATDATRQLAQGLAFARG